ncbi:hypothetical protein F8388_013446 [Cannabis sativa]|uniref:Uncharacterized protein n=1 Tax=Cannabis sativa TaxID=3483 RepID=A0A7J6EXE1_CANSA|nr:hypothetical protein F8388_013446 [Cannabis sativa]
MDLWRFTRFYGHYLKAHLQGESWRLLIVTPLVNMDDVKRLKEELEDLMVREKLYKKQRDRAE